jgi:hypothetical protein
MGIGALVYTERNGHKLRSIECCVVEVKTSFELFLEYRCYFFVKMNAMLYQ